MTAGPHRIRRQSWQVRTDSSAAALGLRRLLRSELDVLTSAFERAFDALGLGERVLRLPRLALSIRLRAGDDFVATLTECVERELTELLRRLAFDGTRPQPPRPVVAPTASWRETLLAYMLDGVVPWYAVTPRTAELLAQLREAARALVAEPRLTIDQLGATPADRFRASFRLVQLLEPPVLVEFLKGLAVSEPVDEPLRVLRLGVADSVRGDDPPLRAAAVVVALRPGDLRPPRSPAVAAWLAEFATASWIGGPNTFESVPGPPPGAGDPRSVEGAKAPEATETGEGDGSLRRSTPTGAGPAAGPGGPAEEADTAIMVGPRAPERPPPAGGVFSGAPPAPTDVARPRQLPRATPIDPIEWAVAPVSDRRPADEPLGLLVPHAGLVLLHPFLPQLFGAVGLRGRERALPSDQLPRAAALMHWLAAGSTEVYEFELPLVKVLVGLAPEDPLPVADGLLSDDDRAEGDALLAAVIGHWAALGKTSAGGLRGSFLRRRGLLRPGDRGWQLRMETESFDVLLGRLPWAVGVVKLPWMPTPMFIDWPTP